MCCAPTSRVLSGVYEALTLQAALGEAMREHRDRLGRSLSDVSRKTGISEDSLSGWERARNWPRGDLLVAWCNEMNIAPSALYASAETIVRRVKADAGLKAGFAVPSR